MAYCSHCGAPVEAGAAFCGKCGSPVKPAEAENNFSTKFTQADEQPYAEYTAPVQQASARSDGYDPADVEQNKILALFAYLGILFLIPLLAAPKSPYARFHANQGIVLFIANLVVSIVVGIVSVILTLISPALSGLLSTLVSLAFLALAILGIYNALTGKAKELPVIGSIKLLK